MNPSLKENVAVFIGDYHSMKYVAQFWSGERQCGLFKIITSSQPIYIADKRERTICLITQGQDSINHWPGGNLVWLVPERGPSMPELNDFIAFLCNNKKYFHSGFPLSILTCLPDDMNAEEARLTIEHVANTIAYAVPEIFEVTLEAVWLSNTVAHTIGEWIRNNVG